MNLFFVVVLHMGVTDVALGTVLSQCIAFALTILCLLRTDRVIKLHLSRISINLPTPKEFVRFGLPAGLQNTPFSIFNVLIQSSINSFSSTARAGNSAAANIEGGGTSTLNASPYQAAITFTSQNVGAKQKWRIRPIARVRLGLNVVIGAGHCRPPACAPAAGVVYFRSAGVGIRPHPHALSVHHAPIGGMMHSMVGIMRGLGHSIVPMFVSLVSACLFRMVWITIIFQRFPIPPVLYAFYPISCTLTLCVHLLTYWLALHKSEWQGPCRAENEPDPKKNSRSALDKKME